MTLSWPLLTQRFSVHPSRAPRTSNRRLTVHALLLPSLPSGLWWRGPDCSMRPSGGWARRLSVPSVAGKDESSVSSRLTTGVGAFATAPSRRT